MNETLSIGALRRAYLSGAAKPVDVLARIAERFGDGDQESVWISTISPGDLAARCAELEKIPSARDLPLFGIPFSVKDNIDVAGFETTAACPGFAYRPAQSASVVAKLEAAGAICIGKTNLDQFATGLVGVRSPYGIPRNPFNADYIPGGSSSGAGVSVSTGMVAFALGTDTGGSGRVPASYNGLYGLKPAPGAWSRTGVVFACRSFDTISVFAAELDDVLAVDALASGPDPADAFSAVFPTREVAHPRVGIARPDSIDTFGDADVARLYGQAYAQMTSEMPAPVPMSVTEVDLAPFQAINDLMFFGPYLAERDVSVGAFIDANPGACHPVVGPMIKASRDFSAADAYRALYRTQEARKATEPFWQNHDVLVTPTVGALLTLDACAKDPLGPNFQNGTYTNFASPLGLSALSVPFGVTPAGVPWGLTFYTPPERVLAAVDLARVMMAQD